MLCLAHGRPVGPDAAEREQRPAFVQSKPDGELLAVDSVLFTEAGEWHQASVLGPSECFQWPLFVLRMFVVPESASIRSSSLKSTVLPLASNLGVT